MLIICILEIKLICSFNSTDSLIYQVRNQNIYDVMRSHLDEFDTSDYGYSNQFDMPLVNKKVPGKMKDECTNHVMTHFIGLRSKMYCLQIEDKKFINKAKGISKNVAENKITFDDYYKCLFDREVIVREQHIIRARKHNIHTETEKKVALSSNDDKRYLIPESTETLPWGHYAIPTDEEVEEPPTKKQKI